MKIRVTERVPQRVTERVPVGRVTRRVTGTGVLSPAPAVHLATQPTSKPTAPTPAPEALQALPIYADIFEPHVTATGLSAKVMR